MLPGEWLCQGSSLVCSDPSPAFFPFAMEYFTVMSNAVPSIHLCLIAVIRMFQMAGQVCWSPWMEFGLQMSLPQPSAPMQLVCPPRPLPGPGQGDMAPEFSPCGFGTHGGLPGHLCPLSSGLSNEQVCSGSEGEVHTEPAQRGAGHSLMVPLRRALGRKL